ncbi:MAG TPA: HAMP domain-containing sensor histidine kinase [Candidatus Binatia bacterium]|nr:HAMP domain-containing sensor histidine kinase [Candidatus Binatia bacterium]
MTEANLKWPLVTPPSIRFDFLFGVSTKRTVILIRWPVVLICSYLLLYPSTQAVAPLLVYPFILLYIASNVALGYLGEARFQRSSFYTPLVIADTVVLTLSLVLNGQVETDFYLTYFLLIIICCILENPKTLTVVAVLAPVIYGLLLFRSPASINPDLFLRFPFLLIIALFCGYFTQLHRVERLRKEEAEQHNRGKTEALHLVSHEFKTPLHLISGWVQALDGKMFGEVSAEQSVVLNKILRQTENLSYMVSSILDLARIEAGETAVQREVLPLVDFFEEIRLNYDVPIDKPVSLHWFIDRNLPTLRSDRVKLTIILQNLINNAIKFTEQGSVTISARRAPRNDAVDIEVSDTGIGIPKEALSVIFEKFRQVEGSPARVRGGVGLGLHTVKVFTELLGGSIAVKSDPGQGSTFTLSLPV